MRANQLFVIQIDDRRERPIADDVYRDSGWSGDAPLWIPGENLLLYADQPFIFVSLDGEAKFVPEGAVAQRPFAVLYAADLRQVIGEINTMDGPAILVHKLSDDLRMATDSYTLERSSLVSWFAPGESIVILEDNSPRIWSLTAETFVGD